MKPESPMEPDEYQQAWHAQSSQTRVTIDANLLQQEVLRNQRDFLATIFRRDFVEIGVGLLLLPYWLYQGLTKALPWTWYLTVPAILWVIGFFLVDRKRHPQTPSAPDEPLLVCAKNSLAQVEHQVWLLRNVAWWYILPFVIAFMAYFVQVSWRASSDWWEFCVSVAIPGLVLLVLTTIVYYINQLAVRRQLEPRRQELRTMLASLSDEMA